MSAQGKLNYLEILDEADTVYIRNGIRVKIFCNVMVCKKRNTSYEQFLHSIFAKC